MRKIFSIALLMSLCSSAIGQVVPDTIKHNPITESNIKLSEIVITGLTGNQKLKQSPIPVLTVSPRQLEALPSTNIIDAIAHQPGISQITTGSGISKPVIRGLGYNRVVVVNNGIRQEGQQWGDEHGIEVNSHAVYSAEVLKGPASLMYGSDAMAGVIIFHQFPTLPQGEMKANVSTSYQTNNGLFDYSLNFAGNKHGFVWNSLYSGKMAHSYKNKYDGYVFGSAFREQAFSQMLGYNHRNGFSHLTLDFYHLTPGIIEGERNELSGALEVPDGYKRKSYKKPLPYQQIHHYKAVLDNSWRLFDGSMKFLLGYQQNRRQEYEEVEHPNECGLDFLLHTINYDLHYLSPSKNGWKFSTGINGMWQNSTNKGTEFLIPDYKLFDYGLFATINKEIGKLNISGGIRYDQRHLHSKALMEEDVCRFENFKRTFQAITGSAGLAYELSQNWNIKINVSRGFRAPNISELASNGVHEGTQRYELGNNQLKAEESWQADLGLDYTSPIISAQIALFANHISHYVFIQKMPDKEDGEEATIDGTSAYQFASSNARIWGGEANIDIHPLQKLHIENTFSYVNAVQLHQPAEAKYLPYTPAPRWCADIKYEFICNRRTFSNLFLKFAIDCNLRQNHFYAVHGTETSTPSYTLFHLYAGTDIKFHGRRILSLYLSGENLTNRAYQSHLSRLKYLDKNPATGRMGVYNMGRNFSLKLVLPINL